MRRNKLQRFAEIKGLPHVFEPEFEMAANKTFPMRGKWASEFFENDHPIVLELGCGKGEYTVGLAEKYPNKNFIGVDIKGDRMWIGAKDITAKNIKNAAFLRTWVDYIDAFFDKDEISEIWLTFPDPQISKLRKRLSSTKFLTTYRNILQPDGIIHLKTDSQLLHYFTLDVVKLNNLPLIFHTDDLYHSGFADEILEIKTFYEKNYLARGLPITYIQFKLKAEIEMINPEENRIQYDKEVTERKRTRTNQLLRGQGI